MQVFTDALDAVEEAQFCADSEHIPYAIVFDETGFGGNRSIPLTVGDCGDHGV